MFPIIDVADWVADQSEAIGTKDKTWMIDPAEGSVRWLAKWNRTPAHGPPQGEDWSEKIASELAILIGLPTATVELARGPGNRLGIVSRTFVGNTDRVRLTHGNELMARVQDDYPAEGCRDNRCYTVENVVGVVEGMRGVARIGVPSIDPPPMAYPDGVYDGLDVLIGYLLLDALVGNSDRHHQNWAVLEIQGPPGEPGSIELTPTFDHASSLGRELSDHKRHCKCDLDDDAPQGSISRYVERCASPFYLPSGDGRHSVLDAFVTMAVWRPVAGRAWLDRLQVLNDERVGTILDQVPADRMSAEARLFVRRVLRYSLARFGRTTLPPTDTDPQG